ncbi:hypothetical protein LTR78_007988 [Recurvomyces mirabilis]|uniref:Uncharacterized protein n=1 Tax=Recurvomyces mirabilis TaxID=574656 RepID=A0AAE0TR17_9PEZI|nr:hypothetical protein LTR78_007988 [Recurvomyces mirabilis]KAK5152524.1 hypothetical protein LTS14_008471 [Recurvomyces mirabilis]
MATPWTEAEKLGLLFQIIEKAGTIPWSELTLPEGRTQKACSVMVDKEKQKVKKARLAKENGEEPEADATPKPKKRAGGKKDAEGDEEEDGSPKKKVKTPRKKKTAVKAGNDQVTDEKESGASEEGLRSPVKGEPVEEDF